MQQALAEAPALVAVTQGPMHQLVYANDAFRSEFGARGDAPPSLGRLDDVFASGRARSHQAGHMTYVYAPLRTPSGEVTGLLILGVAGGGPRLSSVSSSRYPQHDLLPPALHQPEEMEVAARDVPGAAKTEARGDWYDVIPIGAGRTALVVGDVMASGAQAAAIMSQLRLAVRAYARLDLPPADVLDLLDAVVSDLPAAQNATCLYATFDPVESVLSYATAGHPRPLLRSADGTVRLLGTQAGAPLGVPAGPFAVQEVPVPDGSTLLMYTAGLRKRRDKDSGDGIAELAEALSGADGPLEELADTLAQRSPPALALLLVRSTPAPTMGSARRSMRLQLSSGDEPARRARAYASGVLSAWQLPQPLRDDIVLVVSELVVNAVLHSGTALELRLWRTSQRVVLEVLDRSPRVPRPRPADPHAESGRGLHIVAQLADRWGARPLNDGKSVWCEFLASSGAGGP